MSQPRVRIAPSPTGNLHVGTARTALFNYLFAKNTGGKFILRIEDTDLERSQEVFVKNIYDSLKALGLSWDEGPDVGGEFGPYVQTERLERYNEKAQELIDKGLAYYCYCTQEELDQEKEKAKQAKAQFVYNKRCSNLTEEEKEQFIKEGRIPTLRFKVPEKEIIIEDIVKNKVVFDTALTGDFVIMKSNGTPTYNFAVVIDDMDMKITHIIRGEDHISNTPRQILLYEAYNYELPKFAHVGMILAPDKSKLSKRHGATAVSEFIENGYLPEAFVNFLALLGWSPSDSEEVKTLDQIIADFSLERISSSPAVFDKEKLNWLNGYYIRNLPIDDITNRCKKYLTGFDLSKFSDEQLQSLISEIRERITTLNEAADGISFLFEDYIKYDDEVKENALTGEHVKDVMEKFLALCDELNFDDKELLNEQFKEFRKSLKPLKPKFIMMPVRAILTGRLHGIDLMLIIQLLGKEIVKKRAQEFLKTL